ncbi:MAG: glycosyltransferase family 4 protein [Lachnospiraceae bacterium]|nr:glycosyltransferase family 4 protein [Lachnospiraceae bacterium]
MKRVAFVTQRYGLEVNGGAELQCRLLAEHLCGRYEVEAISTKAIDYVTWKDEYTEDQEVMNGVLVRRFSVEKPRDNAAFNRFSEKVFSRDGGISEQEQWMDLQGPHSEALIRYLAEHIDDYDAFVFCCYLYYPTYYGLKAVGKKAILISDAHDELPIHLGIFRNMFTWPAAFFFNTKEEKRFVESKFAVAGKPDNDGLGGVGIDLPQEVRAERFYKKFGLKNFILYIGRIEEHKGCKEMFQYFAELKKRHPEELADVKLVLMGKAVMEVPESDDIVELGFVSEEDKYDGIAACSFLWLPSKYESLSIVVLEAMALQKPVVIDADCEVVRGHCIRSNGGLYYRGFFEFEGCVMYLQEHAEQAALMGQNGQAYVEKYYAWDAIVERLAGLIEKVS